MSTTEQRRAKDALARVKEIGGESKPFKERYGSYVDRLGPAIVMNGLGQALATELAAASDRKGDDKRAHYKLYDSVQRWLCRKDEGVYPSAPDLLTAIMEHDQSRYLRAQGEALAWLEWHKKFCRAYLPADDGGGE